MSPLPLIWWLPILSSHLRSMMDKLSQSQSQKKKRKFGQKKWNLVYMNLIGGSLHYYKEEDVCIIFCFLTLFDVHWLLWKRVNIVIIYVRKSWITTISILIRITITSYRCSFIFFNIRQKTSITVIFIQSCVYNDYLNCIDCYSWYFTWLWRIISNM